MIFLPEPMRDPKTGNLLYRNPDLIVGGITLLPVQNDEQVREAQPKAPFGFLPKKMRCPYCQCDENTEGR